MKPAPLDHVILVDDSLIDNKLHARVIRRTGLARNIHAFAMAEDALAYLRTPGAIPANLILLDINMPRMNGFEMIEAAMDEFGQDFAPSPVVMLTTSSNPADHARAGTYPVVRDYMHKPLTETQFSDLVETLTG